MPSLKSRTIVPSTREDAAITAAALADPDTTPLDHAQWQAVRPLARIGRPPSAQSVKVATTIRFDADVPAALRASGRGWQTRVNDVVREWLKRHLRR